MSIFTLPTSTTQTLTTAQLQVKAAQQITQLANQTFQQVIKTLNANFSTILANPNGLTPQQVFDALGTNAATILNAATVIGAAINQIVPNAINVTLPANTTFVPNQDGTVTVTVTS